MCGIIGVIAAHTNGFTNEESEVFTDMLFVDTLRGMDSTGVFGVNRHNNVLIHKEASNGLTFIQTNEYKSFKNKMWKDALFAVGHNRAATRGSVVDKNAHPFWVNDKIVLVQNGTYRGSHKHLKDTDVDTEALAHVLDEEPDVAKALQKINAAYALVWYNTATRTLSMIRNAERPLFLAKSKDGTVVFASEFATIAWACHRHNIPFDVKPELIPINTLHTFTSSEDGTYVTNVKPIDCDYVPPVVVHKGLPFRGYGGAWDEDDDGLGVGPAAALPMFPRNNYMPPAIATPHGSPSMVNKSISTIVMTKYPEFHMSTVDTQEFETRIRQKINSGNKSIPIELIDYEAANDHKDCTTFIVFGRAVEPILGEGPQPLYHWIVYDKTEADVMMMVATVVFYTVDIVSCISTYFYSNHKKERSGILTCYTGNQVPAAVDTHVM